MSTTVAGHSRLRSSITFRMRNLRPQDRPAQDEVHRPSPVRPPPEMAMGALATAALVRGPPLPAIKPAELFPPHRAQPCLVPFQDADDLFFAEPVASDVRLLRWRADQPVPGTFQGSGARPNPAVRPRPPAAVRHVPKPPFVLRAACKGARGPLSGFSGRRQINRCRRERSEARCRAAHGNCTRGKK